jgi:hypothetical protein
MALDKNFDFFNIEDKIQPGRVVMLGELQNSEMRDKLLIQGNLFIFFFTSVITLFNF